MQRVAVIGPAGAGKTTLALELARALGVELVQLDRLFWQPRWVKTSPEECEALQRTALAGEAWVADSAAPRALRSRLEAADTIVFLDLPLSLCALRALRRRLRTRRRARAELAPGCIPSRLDRAALRYLTNVWTYKNERRPQILGELARVSGGRRIVILRRPRQVRRFLERTQGPDRSARNGGAAARNVHLRSPSG